MTLIHPLFLTDPTKVMLQKDGIRFPNSFAVISPLASKLPSETLVPGINIL